MLNFSKLIYKINNYIENLGEYRIKIIFLVLVAFILGVFSTISITYVLEDKKIESQTTIVERAQEDSNIIARVVGYPEEKASPYDRISESQIKVEKDKVIITIENAQWSRFTDTNSMDPVIDYGSNAIQIVPKSEAEIHVGDIISYESEYSDGIIIHRVTEIGYDEKGWYCKAKGDNNPREDPGKIRFNQIKRVVVAVIY